MGNDLNHSKKDFQEFAAMSSEEAENKGYKEKDFDEIKVLVYRKYSAATWDFHQIINILCPYCFYSEKRDLCIYQFKDEKFREKYKKQNSSKREQYTKEMADEVNKGIIENELEFLKYFNKNTKCEHFYHEECKIKRNHKKCLYCQIGLTVRFVPAIFGNFPDYKNSVIDLLFTINSRKRNSTKMYEDLLRKNIKLFLTKNSLINEELRAKYKLRYLICEKLRDINFTKFKNKIINLSDDINKDKDLNQMGVMTFEEAKKQSISNLQFDKLKKAIYELYFSFIELDVELINNFCIFCFRSKREDINLYNILDIDYKNKYIKTVVNKKEQYEKEIVDKINKGMIENEVHLIEYFNKEEKCKHFFHEECKKSRKFKNCLLCKKGFTSRFISIFFPLITKEIQKKPPLKLNELLFKINGNKDDEKQNYNIILLKKIRDFLMKNEMINKEIREKYAKRILFCDRLRTLNAIKFKYKTFNLNEDFNENSEENKKLIEDAKIEAEIIKLYKSEKDKCLEGICQKGQFEYFRNICLLENTSKGKINYKPDNLQAFYCFYYTIKEIDPRYINLYCPFCLKTKNGKSIFEPVEEIKSSKNKIDLSNEKKELIISAIKEGKIESDLNVISFIKKKECLHFYHQNCFEISKIHTSNIDKNYYCYFCKFSLNEINLSGFKNLSEYEELKQALNAFQGISNDSEYKNYKDENFHSQYELYLIKEIRGFLSNEDKDWEIKKKFKERIDLCEKFRKFNYSKYSLMTIEISKNEEFLNIKKKELEELIEERERERRRIEERERERERRRREEEEEEEEEERNHQRYMNTEPDNYYPKINKNLSKRRGITLRICDSCSNKCVICRSTSNLYSKTYLGVHEQCYKKINPKNQYQCFFCGRLHGKGVRTHVDTSGRYCHDCSREFKFHIQDYCIYCKQKFY